MNCERFHDQLFDLLSGKLQSTDVGAMLEHSSQCRECDAVLSLEETLQADRAEGVMDNVPESWVSSMWPAVMDEIGAGPTHPLPSRAIRVWGWARFAVAGLLTVLLIGTGYVLGQRVSTEGEAGPRLAGTRVDETMDAATTARLTLADLLAAVDRLPNDITLLSSDEAQGLLRQSLPLRRWASAFSVPLDLSDGVQVGELRAVLEERPRDGTMELPASLNAAELRWWLRRRV